MASSARVKPGQKGKIIATVDTNSKMGRIVKTIEVGTNDPLREKVTLEIVVKVVQEHPTHTGDSSKNIFSEGCRECHEEKGGGKLGKELFFADCAMCHIHGNKKRVGQPISILSFMPRSYLRKVIRSGTSNPMMPGFGKDRGGPLGEAEIESLIQYIKGER